MCKVRGEWRLQSFSWGGPTRSFPEHCMVSLHFGMMGGESLARSSEIRNVALALCHPLQLYSRTLPIIHMLCSHFCVVCGTSPFHGIDIDMNIDIDNYNMQKPLKTLCLPPDQDSHTLMLRERRFTSSSSPPSQYSHPPKSNQTSWSYQPHTPASGAAQWDSAHSHQA